MTNCKNCAIKFDLKNKIFIEVKFISAKKKSYHHVHHPGQNIALSFSQKKTFISSALMKRRHVRTLERALNKNE
jgi:hypothetical protein